VPRPPPPLQYAKLCSIRVGKPVSRRQRSDAVPHSVTRRIRAGASARKDAAEPVDRGPDRSPGGPVPLRGLSLCETGAGYRRARIETRGHRAGGRNEELWAGRTAHRQRYRC
jgi:hypothetical protein